jgi:hypothetical protein
MFNRNEWLQWAQQSQNKNTEMNDFRNDYWRKNDATKSYMNPNRTVREDSQKNEPIELVEGEILKNLAGGVKNTGKAAKNWALGTDRPIKLDRQGNPIRRFYPKKYPLNPHADHYVKGKEGRPHPEAGETIKVEPKERWTQRAKTGAANLGTYGAQYAVFTVPSPFGRKNPERAVGQSSREFDEESVQHVGTDLQELGAQGWKNVATGAKVADKISDLAMIGGLIAAPFTGGLSLAATAGGLAAKTATKAGTKLITKQATKMATKQATKQATKTGSQKALDVAGRVGTDVATYGAINKLSGGGNQKADTTAQIQPNKIQQDTGPIAKIEPAKPRKQKLAASYDPELIEKFKFFNFNKAKPMAKKSGKYMGQQAAGGAAMAAGMAAVSGKGPKPDTTAQVQNPTGTARNA